MIFDKLTDDNFELFAAHHYKNNKASSLEDFYEDLLRVKYIKRLLTKYNTCGSIQERLLLNHIIIFCNTFTISGGKQILFNKVEPVSHPALKTFLLYLNYLRDDEYPDITPDMKLVEKLREI